MFDAAARMQDGSVCWKVLEKWRSESMRNLVQGVDGHQRWSG